ncbi:MAG: DnaJ domain-containing protein [Gammaproteobacteria bacterium]|nr:DnaJ domain-containing protein [Gammaproteobacteria bacterium]
MDFKDYYKVLDVDPSAPADEIKRVYKKLARKYHPDVSDEPDAQEKFQEVSEAYEVLRNKEKRAEYDELREYVNNPNKFQKGDNGQYHTFDSNFSAEDQFEDLLRSIFGDRSGSAGGFTSSGFGGFDRTAGGRGESPFGGGQAFRRESPKQDSRHTLHITLEEAWAGGERQLRLSTPEGSSKTINVKIPKGITSGKELRLRGQSGDGGDLYLKIEIERHPVYRTEGRDILLTLPVSPWKLPSGLRSGCRPSRRVNLKIPANSQGGNKLRLKGRGLGDGDQIVTLKIVNPDASDDESREAFETLSKQFDFDPREVFEKTSS